MSNIKNASFDKTTCISEVLAFFKGQVNINKIQYNDNFEDTIKAMNEIMAKYFYLYFSINESNGEDNKRGRGFYLRQYLCAIINNHYGLKDFFQKGLQVQVHLLLRNQFEFINALIAFIGDDDNYSNVSSVIDESTITPGNTKSKRALKKIFEKQGKEKFKKVWSDFENRYDFLYSNLSDTSHGNLFKVSMFSFNGDEANVDVIRPALGGGYKPMGQAINILEEALDYFDEIFIMLFAELYKKGYFNKKSDQYKILL